jgi:hypothetical protein
MLSKPRKLTTKKKPQGGSLPKGFKVVAPIKNRKLRDLVMGSDITASGGIHAVSDGHPLLRRSKQPLRFPSNT